LYFLKIFSREKSKGGGRGKEGAFGRGEERVGSCAEQEPVKKKGKRTTLYRIARKMRKSQIIDLGKGGEPKGTRSEGFCTKPQKKKANRLQAKGIPKLSGERMQKTTPTHEKRKNHLFRP